MKHSSLPAAFLSLVLASYAGISMGQAASKAADAQAAAPKMTHLKNVQGMKIASMNEPGINADLEDVVTSNDVQKPITCGMFRMEKGAPLSYLYPYDETKIMLEGEMTVSDGHSTAKVVKGDVLHFPKGSNITFSSDDYGLAFICGQRAKDAA